MIRPDAAARLNRWRDALIGAAALAAGLWLVATGRGLGLLFGVALLAIGGTLLFTGIRRARFRTGAAGPGVMRVDEGRVLYMGPLTGGMVALDDVQAVAFAQDGDAGTWHLHHTGGPPLEIPRGAEGEEALLDALAALPGLDPGAVIRALEGQRTGKITVWRRTTPIALT